jgi:hypothetical protein
LGADVKRLQDVAVTFTREIACFYLKMADKINGLSQHGEGGNPMATSPCHIATPAYSGIDRAAVIALVLKKIVAGKSLRKDWPYIRDVSRVLYDLGNKGFKFRNLGLRPDPRGYYSEDVEIFLGQLLSMGYATQRSPISLELKGEQLCDEIVEAERKAKGEEVRKLEQAVDDLLRPLLAAS